MEKKKEQKNKIQIIDCPICKEHTCHVEEYPEVSGMKGYLCKNCGHVSNTEFKKGSKMLKKALESMPELIKDKSIFVEDLGIYFFLSVIQTADGHVFPMPKEDNKNDWEWTYMPVVAIPKNERSKYPVPGKEGENYQYKLSEENAIKFDKKDFRKALVAVGLEKKDDEINKK